MKIARYVGDLLYDYECVVIPGLGGFITKDKPVSINEVTHNFSPPYRDVHFNVHLRTNDGLLVNHVAQQEQIGYKTAKQRVDQFVFQCHNALNSGKKINFKNIGSIHFDADKNIIFQQDTKVNYNSNSFGLTSLVSPVIRRVSDEEKVKKIVKSAIDKNKARKKPVDRKHKTKEKVKKSVENSMQANRKTSTFTNNVIFLLVVAFIMGSGYIYMRRDAMSYYFDKYSSHVPFFYSSVNDYLSKNINSTHVAQLSRSTTSFFPIFLDDKKVPVTTNNNIVTDDFIIETDEEYESVSVPIDTQDQLLEVTNNDEVEDVVVIDESNIPEKDVITKVSSTKPSIALSDKFFIIAGSFSNESNATRLVSKLKSQGFDALIADTNKYGMYRVAFLAFSNRAKAENRLVAIRDENNPKAWLLVK